MSSDEPIATVEAEAGAQRDREAKAARAQRLAEAVANTDADSPNTFTITTSSRDLSCSGRGTETHRRIALPGWQLAHAAGCIIQTQWPSGRLGPRGQRSADRHASVTEDMPIGTILMSFTRDVEGHTPRGSASVKIGIVTSHGIQWMEHRTLRTVKAFAVAIAGIDGEVRIEDPRNRGGSR